MWCDVERSVDIAGPADGCDVSVAIGALMCGLRFSAPQHEIELLMLIYTPWR
jgi:hypothetical protein